METGLRLSALFAAATIFLISPPTLAQDRVDESDIGRATPPGKFSVLQTFGDEKCPPPVGDEIVVCATAPEGDRYRIPRKLRKEPEEDMAGGAWPAAVETLDEVARNNRPDSCSPNGSYGQTGCTQALLRQWFAERRGKLNATAN